MSLTYFSVPVVDFKQMGDYCFSLLICALMKTSRFDQFRFFFFCSSDGRVSLAKKVSKVPAVGGGRGDLMSGEPCWLQ